MSASGDNMRGGIASSGSADEGMPTSPPYSGGNSATSPPMTARATPLRRQRLNVVPPRSPVYMPSTRQAASPLRLPESGSHVALNSRATMLGSELLRPRDTMSAIARLRMFLEAPRHEHGYPNAQKEPAVTRWRSREKIKTAAVGLVMCLNIGFEPPDVMKASPCARLESWTNPFALPPQKSLEKIGVALQDQYTQWQPRARYKILMDPTVDHVRGLCLSLRRMAKDDRVLFHYNGHGVPRPTSNGELWMFNPHYTQYVPVSVYDLQQWCTSPSVFVLDCSSAGILLPHFASVDRNPGDAEVPPGRRGRAAQHQLIVLAACGADETLPLSPEVPADLFTSCLTTPIQTALRWLVCNNKTVMAQLGGDLKILDEIKGNVSNRRTPLGELNWVLTAITDSIAWNVLPTAIFQRLFRLDILVSCLFRNFLLADRIMRTYGVTPMSMPELPSTAEHSLWGCWDVAAEACVAALPGLLGRTLPPVMPPAGSDAPASQDAASSSRRSRGRVFSPSGGSSGSGRASGSAAASSPVGSPGTPVGSASLAQAQLPQPPIRMGRQGFPRSSFFADQLTAFEVWLQYGKETPCGPEQLPIVLQVLLSQPHRLRALALLARFLDLGPWAGNLALTVGIFPYVIKLLQSPDPNLRHILVLVWARIMALDRSCQNDLVNNNGHLYFISHLAAGPLLDGVPQVPPQGARLLVPGDYIWLCMKTAKGDYHRRGAPVFNVPYATAEGESPPGLTRHAGDCIPFDQRVQAAFVLCMIMDGHRLGQHCCLQQSLHITIATHLHDPCPKLRFWQCLCLFKLWENFEDARVPALMERLPDTLVPMLLTDASPEVRAGAAVALGALLRGDDPCASSDADDVDFEYGVFAPPVLAPRGPQREQPEGFVSAAWMLAMQAASKSTPRHGFTHSHSRRPRVQSDLGAAVATPRGPPSAGRAPVAGDGATPPVNGAQAATTAAPLSPEQGPSTPREPSPFDAIHLPGRRVSRAMMELALCVCAVPACQDASPLVRSEVLLTFARLVVHPRHAAALRIVAAASILHRKSGSSSPQNQGDAAPKDDSTRADKDSADEDVLNAVLAAGATYADLQSLSDAAGNGKGTTPTSGRNRDGAAGAGAGASSGARRRPRAGSEGHISVADAAVTVRRRNLSNAAIAMAAQRELAAYLRPNARRHRPQQPRRRRHPSDASAGSSQRGRTTSSGGSSGTEDVSPAGGGSPIVGAPEEAFAPARFAHVTAHMRPDDVLLQDVVGKLGERGALYLLFWRTLLRMQRDAWPSVSRAARILVLRVRAQLYSVAAATKHSAAGSDSDGAASGGPVSDGASGKTGGGATPKRRSRRAQLAGSTIHVSRSAVDLRAAAAAASEVPRPKSQHKSAVLASASLQTLGLTSQLLVWARQRFQKPLLQPFNKQDNDPLGDAALARADRHRQLERAIKTALALTLSGRPDPQRELAAAVAACSTSTTRTTHAPPPRPLPTPSHQPSPRGDARGFAFDDAAVSGGRAAASLGGAGASGASGGRTLGHPQHPGGASSWETDEATPMPALALFATPRASATPRAHGGDGGGGGGAGSGLRVASSPFGRVHPRNATVTPVGSTLSARPGTGLDGGLADLQLPPTEFSALSMGESRRQVEVQKSTVQLVASLSQADVERAAMSQRKLGQKSIFDNESKMTSLLLFHPYETSLVVADDSDGLSFWNYEEGKRTRRFHNARGTNSRVTSLEWINEYDNTLLAVGGDDGMVRVWRNCLDPSPDEHAHSLVTGFCALPELVTSAVGPGVVMQWQPEPGHLVTAGHTSVMRVWDLETERCVARCVTPSRRACITSLTNAWPGSCDGLVVAGCSDGAIHILDPRVHYRADSFDIDTPAVVPGPTMPSLQRAERRFTLHEHKNWLVQVAMQRSGSGQAVYSGSISGSIKFWDLRRDVAVRTIKAHQGAMRALVVHDYAPVMASGSKGQHIRLWSTTTGEAMGTLRYHQGFLGQRIGPVSCLSFHRHKMFLGIGATDSIVSIYTGHS